MANRDLNLEREWKIRFEEYKKSGLSVKAWCEKNGIKSTTFHYWIKRFNNSEQKVTPAKVQFAKVILQPDNTNNAVTNIIYESKKIHLSYGSYTIGIEDSFNPATLAELLKVLQKP
ncbi:MAG: IS66 family insertion sequence element accessory protein TnpA [Bacillota bacterium]